MWIPTFSLALCLFVMFNCHTWSCAKVLSRKQIVAGIKAAKENLRRRSKREVEPQDRNKTGANISEALLRLQRSNPAGNFSTELGQHAEFLELVTEIVAEISNNDTSSESENATDSRPMVLASPGIIDTQTCLSRYNKPFETEIPCEELSDLLSEGFLSESRVKSVKCIPGGKYRSLSGWCNNLENPHYGSAFSFHQRLLPPAYDDGISVPRTIGCAELPLPNARAVSRQVHLSASISDTENTMMVVSWGQFLAHDIELTPASESSDELCNCASCFTTADHCFPITVTPPDPKFFGCLPFVRSKGSQLSLGQRQQQNAHSSFIDAGNIYSSNIVTLNADPMLRLVDQDGKMRTGHGNLLPNDTNIDSCDGSSKNIPCFLAGDVRNSQNAALTSMHTLWVREHNRIAGELKAANVQHGWSDEKLFQETRRIVIALHQHITFNEFLVSLLPERVRELYDIEEEYGPKFFQPENGSNCDPTTFNEFSTAAFRIGHTLIDNFMKRSQLQTANGGATFMDEIHLLDGNWFDTSYFHKEGFSESATKGHPSEMCQAFDKHFTSSVQQGLFASAHVQPSNIYDPCASNRGTDLVALNIQRGRDHGIQPYTAYRRFFGLPVPDNFTHLKDMQIMDNSTVDSLSDVYNLVHDVDLFVGIVSEKSPSDGLVGELGSHIIATQFRRFKHCDRYFFSSKDSPAKLTTAQLRNLRDIRLSDVMCNHLHEDAELQGEVFMRVSQFNKLRKCKQRRKINFALWKEPEVDEPLESTEIPLCPHRFIPREQRKRQDGNTDGFRKADGN